MLEDLVLFCRALRERGLAVTPAEAIDATTALGVVDLDDRQEVFLGLRSVLTCRVEDWPIFEELFADFWSRLHPSSRTPRQVRRQRESNTDSRVRRSEPRHTTKGLAYLIENWMAPQPADSESMNMPSASNAQNDSEKDFSRFSPDQMQEIARLAQRIARRAALRPGRRWKPVRRGPRVHLRRMLRQSLRMGGEIVELSFRERKPNKTRLVVICDVSGSMDMYSRLLLQFVYGLQNSFALVETFAFSTSLERITGHLKDRAYSRALEQISANVRGWSGGTLIGESIRQFNSRWARLVDKRTIVIILSDGWDTGEPEELAASLAVLKGRAARLIWLNPLLGNESYQPLTRGMQAALPYVDLFVPAHNVASLRVLERHLIL